MKKISASGKSTFRKGVMQYFWAEMKTLNLIKFKALCKIVSGYVLMKIASRRMERRAITQRT